MSEIVYSTAQLVGHTPLMELVNYEAVHGITAHLLAKLESYNPSGSIKDRAALQMIREAERRGDILPGDTSVEQTSGNTGIAIAALAIPMGYQVEIFLERGASLERREMLEAFGVKLLTYRDALGIRTDAEREAGWQEPEREATLAEIEAYCRRQKKPHFFLNQAENRDNPRAHILTTGPELWEQTGGKVDVLVCMAGTGGTMLGLSTYLREKNPALRVIVAQPAEESRLSGKNPHCQIIDGVLPVEGVPDSDIADFVRDGHYDEAVDISAAEAFATARELAGTEGLLIGTSSAAALLAARRVCQRGGFEDQNVVVIMPDNGMKYLSTPCFHRTE